VSGQLGARRGTAAGLGLVLLTAVLTGGCPLDMPKKAAEDEVITQPEWRVGDRWSFKRTTLAGASGVVTHQVVGATTNTYTVRVLGLGGEVTREWTTDFHLTRETFPDGTTVRYQPPALFFNWPLKLGATWSQEFQYSDGRNDGRYSNTWKVAEGIEAIDTVAGRFYVLRIERWSGTRRLVAYWYSPRIRYFVRLEDYLGGYVEELVEYKSWSDS
jgi:hypothetical protein